MVIFLKKGGENRQLKTKMRDNALLSVLTNEVLVKESEAEMLDTHNKRDCCSVCCHGQKLFRAEVMQNVTIYVCESCLEAAKHNFIILCMSCGEVYIIPKMELIHRIKDPELKKAYIQCVDEQIIQGIDMCIKCDPEGILHYMQPEAMEC